MSRDHSAEGSLLARTPHTLLLDPDADPGRLLRHVAARYRVDSRPSRIRRFTFMDTFDWRIHRHEASLSAGPAGEHGLRVSLNHPVQMAEAVLGEAVIPGFVTELPPGPLALALASIAGSRRLLPVVQVDIEEQSFLISTRRDRPVAVLQTCRLEARNPTDGRAGSRLPVLLRFVASHGRPRLLRRLRAHIAKFPGVRAEQLFVAEAAARAIGLSPGDYRAKPSIRLSGQTSVETAARGIHRALLATIRANEAGVRGRVDPEFLHDFRVAVRRTRSVLAQLHDIFPAPASERFKSDFKWLGALTGPTRDLDVYLIKLADYRAELPGNLQPDLEPLNHFLSRHLEQEQALLVQGLDSPRYHALLDDWAAFLDAPAEAGDTAGHAGGPAIEFVSRRIWKVYRRVRKMGRAVRPDTPAEVMHLLRIECKKLRYLVELFRDLYTEADIERLAPTLSELQDNLGDLNDLHVQQEGLHRFAHAMSGEGLAPVDTLLAMGRLVHHLTQRETLERDRFDACFGAFCSRKNHKLVKRLFRRVASRPPI